MTDHNGSKAVKDWRPPPGYESALAKDRKAQKAKEEKKPLLALKSAKVTNHEDTASEGSESGFSETGRTSFFVNALTPFVDEASKMTKTSNSFTGLDADSQEYDKGALASLNNWAHRVHVVRAKKRKSDDRTARYIEGSKKPESSGEAVIIRRDKDVDKASVMMPVLPTDRKSLAKNIKKLPKPPSDREEIVVLMDSGSVTHALDADVELPGWLLEPPVKNMADKIAETACGGHLKATGAVTILGNVDGHQIRSSVRAHEGSKGTHSQCALSC